ncbi:hypothetical protein M8J77_016743 [Diaphorina citri]|nr:hypothetical protein M8J77_016743 [Diaphorina citri]
MGGDLDSRPRRNLFRTDERKDPQLIERSLLIGRNLEDKPPYWSELRFQTFPFRIENLHQNNNNHLPIKSHNAGDTMGDHGDNHATETATEATIVENSMEKPKENHTAPAEPMSDKPEGRQGPNQILDSDLLYTTEPHGRTRILLGEAGVAAQPPISVPGLLGRTAAQYPDQVALCQKQENGEWKKVTYKEYEANVRTVAKAFLKLGLERYHSVCIIGFNAPEWFYSDLGAIYAGGLAKAFLKLGLERYHSVCIIGFNAPEWFYSDLGAIYAGGLAKAFLKLGLERYHSVCIIGFNAPEWFYSDLGAIYAGGLAKAFLKLGLERYHSVCIIGFNAPEWFYSDLGAIYAGGFAAGMYTTNSPEACLHCLVTSDANICVVEDDKQLEKILKVKAQCPKLKAIVQYEGKPDKPGVISWDELMELGRAAPDESLDRVLETIATNECCTLVYTSGTEGASKPVMLSHDNITFNAACIIQYFKLESAALSVISFLPLSHIAAQTVDIYSVMTVAATLWFADKNALKGSLINTLLEVRPHVFLAVPRVWEKIHEKLMAVGKQTTGVKRWIANYAKSTSLQHYMAYLEKNVSEPYTYRLVRWLILSKVKQAMGLDRCRVSLSGAAPISTELKRYFLSLDIPICEVFGMSECAGAHTVSAPDDFKLDGVGRTIPGTQTKIVDPDEEGNGEICLKGRHIFMGYLRLPDKTESTIDKEGWLHSGDVGKVDEDGFVQITGRIKELLITAGGENVAPVPIEHIVKSELPVLSNAFLVGDKKKFLSMLLALRTKMNADTGEPLDELETDTKDWLKSLGVDNINTLSELLEKKPEAVYKATQAAIDRANLKSISNAQKIQKFEFLPADFSIPTGELGPTMKVKRPFVVKKYQSIIDKFYDV